MLFDIGKIQDSILIAGLGRSGTTWLMELLNFDNRYRVIFEPFHPVNVMEADVLRNNWYLSATTVAADEVQNYIQKVVSGKLRNSWSDGRNRRVISNKRIIKVIRANLMLGWLHAHYPELKIILLVRHPYAVSISRDKLPSHWGAWHPTLHDMLAQQNLLEKIQPFINSIGKLNGLFEETLVSWCIGHYIPFQDCKDSRIPVVFYENLLIDPETQLRRIFSYLKRDWDPRCLHKHTLPSSTTRGESVKLNGEQRLVKWRRHISAEQMQWGHKVLKLFGLDGLYGSENVPQSVIEYL